MPRKKQNNKAKTGPGAKSKRNSVTKSKAKKFGMFLHEKFKNEEN